MIRHVAAIPEFENQRPLADQMAWLCGQRPKVMKASPALSLNLHPGAKHSDRTARIILASKSPRRRQLLEQAGLTVTVMPSDFEEGSAELQEPEHYVRTLAKGKARTVACQFPNDWVIGADTIVVVNGQVLGKPASEQEARTMLNLLNGRTHEVYTGWCIHRLNDGYRFSETIRTEVHFKQLAAAEIEWYIHTGEPFDKAGAYAIQGIGAFLVKTIRGSYSNVVGLPVCEVVDHLLKSNIIELNL